MSVRQSYAGSAGESYQLAKHGLPENAPVYEWISKARAIKLQKWIRPQHLVLEFGVGAGWNLARLNCGGKVGFDVSTLHRSLIERRGIRFVEDESAIPLESFDVVVCHHVLEHLSDPFGALERMRGWLRPQGTLIVFVPYEMERRFSRYRRDDTDRHLFSWNVQTMSHLIESAGFELQLSRLQRFGFDRFAAVMAHRFRIGQPGYRALRQILRYMRGTREICAVARVPARRPL